MSLLPVDRLDELLDQAARQRVVVVGDVMLDVYLSGEAVRISPEAPVPVVHVRAERHAVGGAANVAANVCALGAECVLIGSVGRDLAGGQLRETLAADFPGLAASLVDTGGRPTTTKTRVMARHQQVVRYDREDASDLEDGEVAEIIAAMRVAVDGADAVIIEDYNKGVLTRPVIRAVIDEANRQGIPSIADPKFRHFFDYSGVTVFKPNVLELAAALGASTLDHDDAGMKAARQRLGCQNLLVTLGDRGMALQEADRDCFRVPALAREVFDVSGAGDTVSAFVATALAAGATPREAAILANTAAAIEVTKQGVAVVTAEEVRTFTERHREPSDSSSTPKR